MNRSIHGPELGQSTIVEYFDADKCVWFPKWEVVRVNGGHSYRDISTGEMFFIADRYPKHRKGDYDY